MRVPWKVMLFGILLAALPFVASAEDEATAGGTRMSIHWQSAIDVDQQAPEPPAMSPAERAQLAFPGFRLGGEVRGVFPGRMMSGDFMAWPQMRYIGDSAEIAGKTFTLNEVKLVPGGNEPLAYEPATGRKRPAPEGLSTNLFDFSKNTEVFIPPNATLVMLQVDVEPEAVEKPAGEAGCQTAGERDYGGILRVSYELNGSSNILRTSSDENFGRFGSPTIYCFSNGWIYFHINKLDVDPSQLWFEIVDDEYDHQVALWTLTPPP
jgi:hypothetical protein